MNIKHISEQATSSSSSVLVVGMHRSGTSCLTGMLRQYGLYLGDVSSKSAFNPRGNQENQEVRIIDELLLEANGGSWYQPRLAEIIPSLLSLRILRFRTLMKRAKRLWGFKDPRLLFCLNAWHNPSDLLVGTFRHPSTVAKSLARRNSMRKKNRALFGTASFSIPDWEELWYQYNSRILTLYHNTPFPLVNFDWPPSRYRQMVKHIAESLGLPVYSVKEDFFDSSLNHHPLNNKLCIRKHSYNVLYQQLLSIAEEEESKLIRRHLL